jgi:hypothetical protein
MPKVHDRRLLYPLVSGPLPNQMGIRGCLPILAMRRSLNNNNNNNNDYYNRILYNLA